VSGSIGTARPLRPVDAARTFSRKHIGIFRWQLFIGLLRWPLLELTRRLSSLIPRRPGLVAFGSNANRFADNSAYAFLAAAREPHLHAVWITGDRDLVRRLTADGLDARYRWSPGGLLVAARASCYVYSYMVSDVNSWLRGGTTTFQLWHGVGGGKRSVRDRRAPWDRVHAAPARSLLGRGFVEERDVPDWLLTTSPSVSRDYTTTFGVPAERCAELGYPRTDHLVAGARPAAAADRPVGI
jgi:CDP-glycerol glycerophosphotransferase